MKSKAYIMRRQMGGVCSTRSSGKMPNTKKRQEAISTLHAQYVCTFRSEREGGYSVRCAAFPGLITNGKTLEAARANAREALELCIEVYRDKGWPLPASDAEPRGTIKELIPVKLARV